jgi:DNA-directed RNA polymerase subunit RPC12/RpoP
VIVQCMWCGKENRVPDEAEQSAKYRCIDCKTELQAVWEDGSSGESVNAEHMRVERPLRTTPRQGTSKVPAILSGVFLLLAGFGRWPYGFYTLLRFAVCGCCIYLALQAYDLKKFAWVWIMAGMAVLFNPLIPVRLTRQDWQVINLIAAAVVAVSLFTIRAPRAQ